RARSGSSSPTISPRPRAGSARRPPSRSDPGPPPPLGGWQERGLRSDRRGPRLAGGGGPARGPGAARTGAGAPGAPASPAGAPDARRGGGDRPPRGRADALRRRGPEGGRHGRAGGADEQPPLRVGEPEVEPHALARRDAEAPAELDQPCPQPVLDTQLADDED